jgi:D-hydroxyproline dehydrogenase subunit beta
VDRSPDVVIVGAGIVGAAAAHVLSAEGLAVDVVDRGAPASGVTGAGMGHIVVMDDSPAQLQLTAYSRRLLEELAAELPPSCELSRCGTLWIAAGEAELEAVEAKQGAYAEAGIASEVLDGDDVARLEPELRRPLFGALRVPGDTVVYPPGLARWFLDRAVERGARLHLGTEIDALGPREVRAGTTTISAGAVVNAAGPWSGRLSPGLPVTPRKGHLLITGRYPGFCRHQLVELGYLASAHDLSQDSVAFNLQPRPTGQIIIGSSRQAAGWDGAIDRSVLQKMVARAVEFVPGLAGLDVVRTWTGFRPATPDKLPLIGPWPDEDGPWILSGHEGLGIATALGTAHILADLMLERRPELDPAPFRASRA